MGSCKDSIERFLCTRHPVSLLVTFSQEIDIGICVCIGLYHFITCVYLCNHHHSQVTELGYHHRNLPHATSL